jgi:hypothetical protein
VSGAVLGTWVKTHTSRTTSGSMRVRSSPLRSLQQTPSGRTWREQLAGSGIGWEVGATASMAQTGGFAEFSDGSGRGRGTEGASVGADIVAGRKRFLGALAAAFAIIPYFKLRFGKRANHSPPVRYPSNQSA